MDDWLEEYKEQARLDNIQRLRQMPYWAYLRTSEWQQTRRRILERAAYTCELCGDDGSRLNIHHLSYDRIGCEEDEDLLCVCESCHMQITPPRKALLATLKALSVQKGVEFVPPENQRHAKQLEQELLALHDYVPPEYVSFYRLVAALAGDVWPWTPLGVLELVREEQRLRMAALIPNLKPIPRTGREREWDGVRLASTRRGYKT